VAKLADLWYQTKSLAAFLVGQHQMDQLPGGLEFVVSKTNHSKPQLFGVVDQKPERALVEKALT